MSAEETLDFLKRLDAVTDYESLITRCFGACRKSGKELWIKCPWDDGTPEDKFSFDSSTGRWKNHKTGDGGGMIAALRHVYSDGWRERWAAAEPRAQDILFNGKKPDSSQDRSTPSSSTRDDGRRKRTFAERWEYYRRNYTVESFKPFEEAYGIPSVWFGDHGVLVSSGGKFGTDPRLVFAGIDPLTGDQVGHKYRWANGETAEHKKSWNVAGSHAGLIGFNAARTTEHVLLVAGEKDWVVAAHDLPDFHVITNTNGEGTWKSDWAKALAGRDITICYDPDDAGDRGARRAAALLHGSARSVHIAHLDARVGDIFKYLRPTDAERAALPTEVGVDSLRRKISSATPYTPGSNIADVDAMIFTTCTEEGLEPGQIGTALYKLMSDNGAMFFHVDGHEAFCSWRGLIYNVQQTDPKWALLVYRYTNEDAAGGRGYRVHGMMKNLALALGKEVEATSWFARRGFSLYIPLHGTEQRLAKVTQGGIEIVQNGDNDVVLIPSVQIKEFEYWDAQRYDSEKAERAWTLLFQAMNTSAGFQEMISAAVLALPFYAWCETHPIIRFQGPSGSGKSYASKVLTTLFYGQEKNQGGDTMAALFRLAGARMLLSLDNLERENLERNPEMRDLLLRSASGLTRTKSAKDSERETIEQRVSCWIMNTGKTPLGTGYEDLEERLVVIPMGGYEHEGFMASDFLAWVSNNRNLLFNYWLRQIQRILRELEAGSQRLAMRRMPRQHRPRLHEWYALLSVAAGVRPGFENRALEWLSGGSEGETESVFEGNSLVPLLLRIPAFMENDYTNKDFKGSVQIKRLGATVEVLAHGQFLHAMVSQISRSTGMQYPCRDPKTLSYALRSLKRVSEHHGLKIVLSMNPSSIPGEKGTRGRTIGLTIQNSACQPMVGGPPVERQPGGDDDVPF